jgi:hypothetical protein
MQYKIVHLEATRQYQVTFGTEVLETFGDLFEALDYRFILLTERDQAFADLGTEWDA